jgi:hypothetical protein
MNVTTNTLIANFYGYMYVSCVRGKLVAAGVAREENVEENYLETNRKRSPLEL